MGQDPERSLRAHPVRTCRRPNLRLARVFREQPGQSRRLRLLVDGWHWRGRPWRQVPGGQPEPEQLPLLTMVSVHEERVSPISEIRWWANGEGADVHLSRLLQAPSTVSSSQERAEERTACIIRR